MMTYEYDEWDFIWEEGKRYGGFDDRIYVDLAGNKLTGMLEGFYGHKGWSDSPYNLQYVKDGKRCFIYD